MPARRPHLDPAQEQVADPVELARPQTEPAGRREPEVHAKARASAARSASRDAAGPD